jgi:ribosomal protein S18 acetylase RimI-like enzyme
MRDGGSDALSAVTTAIVIRTASRADVPAVLDVWSRARTPYATTADTADLVERLLDRSPDALLVAEHGGSVVGTVIAAWDGWRGNMYRLAVLPSHRRRGIATLLVREGERRLSAQGAERISALVATRDAAACALWRALGFEFDDVAGRFVRAL